MTEGIKISQETAEKEFAKFEDYYEIEEFSKKDQQEVFDQAKSQIVKAIMKGRIEISNLEGDFKVIQTTKTGTRIEYKELNAMAKHEMDKHKGNHASIHALLGSLCGVGYDGIIQLKGVDLSTAENLGAAFLAV